MITVEAIVVLESADQLEAQSIAVEARGHHPCSRSVQRYADEHLWLT